MVSENGTPSSIKSTPPRSSAAIHSGVRSGAGSPAVTYATSAARFCARRRSKVDRMRVGSGISIGIQFGKVFAVDAGVFIAAPGKVDDKDLAFSRRRPANGFRYRVRR